MMRTKEGLMLVQHAHPMIIQLFDNNPASNEECRVRNKRCLEQEQFHRNNSKDYQTGNLEANNERYDDPIEPLTFAV